MIPRSRTDAAIRVLAETTKRGAYRRCAATGKIMFKTRSLAGRAAQLLHARNAGRRWDTVKCGWNNHYHLKQGENTR